MLDSEPESVNFADEIKKMQASARKIIGAGLKPIRIEMNPRYRREYIDYLNEKSRIRITFYDDYVLFEATPIWENTNVPYEDKYQWVVQTKT